MVDYKIFDRDKFTVVGTPTITDDGMLETNQSGCVQTINFNPQDSWEIKSRIIATQAFVDSTDEYMIGNSTWSGTGILRTRNSINAYFVKEDGTDLNNYIILSISLNDVIDLVWGYDKDNSKYYFYLFKNGQRFDAADIISSDKIKSGTLQIGRYSSGQLPRYYGSCMYDLKHFSIEIDNKEVFSGSRNGTLTDKLIYLNDTKQIIKQAIADKGVEITPETPFREYADKIGELPHIVVMTQQEYDDLEVKDPNTLYPIVEE